jgi:16S rRNA (cytosine967-C5)-methyltransferase
MLALRLAGAEILATDVSAKRMAATEARLRRYEYAQRVRCEVMDAAAAGNESEATFDLILCDVPCSGTGTLARNPEIRHRLRAEDIPRQATRQRAILTQTLGRLAPGGRLVYATCSLELEENEHVVEQAAATAGMQRLSVAPLIAGLTDASVLRREAGDQLIGSAVSGDALRTLPGVHACDGFFAAILERN